jgi:hypothetical protein
MHNKHGKGVYTYVDGSYKVGTWENGEEVD